MLKISINSLIIASSFICLVACGDSSVALDSTITYAAGAILASLTAEAPTLTNTLAPIPTATTITIPSPSDTDTPIPPTETPTPIPNFLVKTTLPLREGPDSLYKQIKTLRNGENYYIIGQLDDCKWLQITDQQEITGWIRSDEDSIDFPTSCTHIPRGIFRPPTGDILPFQGSRGWNQLLIENRSGFDSVVILTEKDHVPIAAAYIRNDENFKILKICDGGYSLYYITGNNWNGREFVDNAMYHQHEEYIAFSSSAAALGEKKPTYTYSVWTFTFDPVEVSEKYSDSIPEFQFPKLEE